MNASKRFLYNLLSSGFKIETDVLDTFLMNHLQNYPVLIKIVKYICTLQHGQSAIERGFSVNDLMLLENMLQSSLVNRRLVYDAVKNLKSLSDIEIDNKMMKQCR